MTTIIRAKNQAAELYITRTAAGSYALCHDATDADSVDSGNIIIGQSKENATKWIMQRGGLAFDLSGLSMGNILAASLYVYKIAAAIADDDAQALCVVNGDDLSDTGLVVADYGELLNEVTQYASISGGDFKLVTGWAELPFNATGLAYLNSKVSGWCVLGLRGLLDINNSEGVPPIGFIHRNQFSFSDPSTGDYTPYLSLSRPFPAEASSLVRVTGLVHRWKAGPNPVYELEVMLGGLWSQYFPPIARSISPEPTMPDLEKEPTQFAPLQMPSLREHIFWMAGHTQEEQRRYFPVGVITFRRWQDWVLGLRAMGKEIP